ncbi:MAG: glycosyltransferase family 4 protein [Chloroflexota bacterium]|nr:glycosyltransferase family 4 protein [Chloroflexota bacterium]
MPRERLRIEYNCVREEFLAGAGDRDEFRQRLGIRNGTFVLTVVGRLVPRKGQDVFLQALRLLVERDVPVHGLIVGAPPRNLAGAEALYPVKLQAMADHPSLCKRASFLGHRSDIPAILGASDVVVMPSLDDPFPLAVIEALAAGVPVIASRSGGHAEAIADGVTGLLVPPRDAEALAAAVELLRSEPELRDMLSRNGRAAVREHFSEATLPGRLEALYREAMMLNCAASV